MIQLDSVNHAEYGGFPAQSENRFSDLVLLQGTNETFIAIDTCEKKQKQAVTDGQLKCPQDKGINHPTFQTME